mgnify:FL=1
MPDARFTVPYPEHTHFVGREDDLIRLHAALQGEGPVGINPAAMGNPTGVTGQGGIGKTQLAVAYAYRYREHYPDGVYWLNAAEGLWLAFAGLGRHFLGQNDAQAQKARLWETLRTRFKTEEIRDLCFEMGVNYEEFSPQLGISSLAREVTEHFERRGQLPVLEAAVRRLRGRLAQPEAVDELVVHAFTWLRDYPASLLILDNLAEPAALEEPLTRNCVPARLPGRLLFTTRRRDLGRFRSLELKTLPPDTALRLLLRDPLRQPALNPSHAEHATARDICATFGYLPLALEIAAAHLAKKKTRSLADYHLELRMRGALDVAIDPRVEVHIRHETGLLAALSTQWSLLSKEAKSLLGVAGQLPEAIYVPTARLGLLAGISDQDGIASYFGITLTDALAELDDSSLTVELLSEQVRLHPLIRAFARKQIPNTAEFCEECIRRLLAAFSDIVSLERQCDRRGIDALIEDLLSAHSYLDSVQIRRKLRVEFSFALRTHLRVMRLEAHNLRDWKFADAPKYLAQQLQNRLASSGLPSLYRGPAEHLHNWAWKMRWSARQGAEALVATLVGHSGAVLGVETIFNDRAVSCSNDGVLKLWNLLTGRVERTLTGNWGLVRTVAITPDGTRAIFGCSDNRIRVWNLTNGLIERTLSEHRGVVNVVLVTSDGHRMISGARDGTIRLWTLATGQLEDVLPNIAGEIRALAITHDGHRLISLTYDSRLRIWNVKSSQIEQVLVMPRRAELTSVVVSRDDRYVLAGALDGTVNVWDLKYNGQMLSFKVHERGIRALSLTHDNRQVISGAEDGKVIVLDYTTGKVSQVLVGHGDWVEATSVTADGHLAITGSWDQTLKVWDLTAKKAGLVQSNHKSSVNDLALTPDGRLAISAAQDHTLKLWDIKTGRLTQELINSTGPIRYLTTMKDGRHVVTRAVDGTLTAWNLNTGKDEWTLRSFYSHVLAVAHWLDPSTQQPRWALEDWHQHEGVSVVWISGWKGLRELPLPVVFTEDKCYAVMESGDLSIELLKKKSWRRLDMHGEDVLALTVTKDDKRIIVGFANGMLKVLDAKTGEVKKLLTGHSKAINAVALTPDGLQVVSGSADATIRTWNINSGVPVARIALDAAVTCLAVLPKLPLTVIAGDAAGGVYCLEWVE